ncbi:MAG: peptidylprolyl isomerase [Planctomycetes bacterium]|nr:peptidylprolyl isomerase [Planctomycetota bacterium]
MRIPPVARAACALLLLGGVGLAGYTMGAQQAPAEAPCTLKKNEVARVGSSIITAEDFIERLVDTERQVPPAHRRTTAVLDSLVADRLLVQEAERLEAKAKSRELQAEVESMQKVYREAFDQYNKQLVEEQRRRGAPEKTAAWPDFLKERLDLTEAEFNALLREQAERTLLKRLVVGYWERATVHADAFTILVRSRSDMEAVRERLAKGEDFGALARKYSIDTHAQQASGRVGVVYPADGRLHAKVDEAFWKLAEGECSGAIEVEYGQFYFVKRASSVLANEAAFADLREECLAGANVDEVRFDAWRSSVVASKRYACERRLPGLDCAANE